MVTEEQIVEALAGATGPELKRSLVELDMVRDIRIQDGRGTFTLALTTLGCPLKDQIVPREGRAVGIRR